MFNHICQPFLQPCSPPLPLTPEFNAWACGAREGLGAGSMRRLLRPVIAPAQKADYRDRMLKSRFGRPTRGPDLVTAQHSLSPHLPKAGALKATFYPRVIAA